MRKSYKYYLAGTLSVIVFIMCFILSILMAKTITDIGLEIKDHGFKHIAEAVWCGNKGC